MRLLVLEFLLSQKTALSLLDLEREFEYSDRTTLYRTLKTFEEKLLVHSINDGTGSLKYALCKDDCLGEHHTDLHLHFYCNTCKGTTCLPESRLPPIILPAGFVMEEVSLIAKGICNACTS